MKKLINNMTEYSFGHLSAKFTTSAFTKVDKGLTAVVFASPLSARSPDLCMLWHNGYREKNKAKLLFNLLLKVFAGFSKGVVKLSLNPKPLKYALYGKISDSILVVSSTCGSLTSKGAYKTPYVHTDDEDGIFVYGSAKTCGQDERDIKEISLIHKVTLAFDLIKSGIYAFVKIEGDFFDKLLLALQWFEWVISLRWLYAFYLEQTLSEVVEKYDITKIGCIHEMHFYARVVWQVAAKYKAKSYTVQHAAITPGKMWYFAYPEEMESGLILPDVMYIFNKDVAKLLAPFYANTKFILGCSNRYSHWKKVTPSGNEKSDYYLFVSALAGFDNRILIKTLRCLVGSTKEPMNVRLRFHPFAQIGRKEKKWIRANLKEGLVKVSRGTSLKDDIEGAITVVGMSTTVLEEALLMGRPVVQITDPDFLQYIDVAGIKGAVRKDYRELMPDDLVNNIGCKVDSDKIRERLGMEQPLVTYTQLFSS